VWLGTTGLLGGGGNLRGEHASEKKNCPAEKGKGEVEMSRKKRGSRRSRHNAGKCHLSQKKKKGKERECTRKKPCPPNEEALRPNRKNQKDKRRRNPKGRAASSEKKNPEDQKKTGGKKKGPDQKKRRSRRKNANRPRKASKASKTRKREKEGCRTLCGDREEENVFFKKGSRAPSGESQDSSQKGIKKKGKGFGHVRRGVVVLQCARAGPGPIRQGGGSAPKKKRVELVGDGHALTVHEKKKKGGHFPGKRTPKGAERDGLLVGGRKKWIVLP